MNTKSIRFSQLVILIAVSLFATTFTAGKDFPHPIKWGNITYLNLTTGETTQHEGHSFTLTSARGNVCTINVDDLSVELTLARISLPTTANSLRIFLASSRATAGITTDLNFPLTHAILEKDVVIGVIEADKPLLEHDRFSFPIDRSDGYNWTMEEDSHMFGYLNPDRAHEGMDFDLTGAQSTYLHRLVAIEDATVRWVKPGSPYQSCILLESIRQPGIFYVYQHMDRERVFVSAGQTVSKGDPLGHIWGDGRWTHLHFAVIAPPTVPDYSDRYQYVLNAFPALYDLWWGSLDVPEPKYERGEFRFAAPYWQNGNRQHLSAYSPTLGYGWRLGDWCPASKVDQVTADEERDVFWKEGSALLWKTLFPDTPAAATNPHNWYDFEVRVPNGTYEVRIRCGHAYYGTKQLIEAEGQPLGSRELAVNEFANLPQQEVTVQDGFLTLRVFLADEETPAGLANLSFKLISP